MRRLAGICWCVLLASGPVLLAERARIEGGRFSLEFPNDWKDAGGLEDGALLDRVSPDREGSFAVYSLKVAKDHRASLEGTLKQRLTAIKKAGMSIVTDVKSQKKEFDGKKGLFAVIPVEAGLGGAKVPFTYYLVLLDAKDRVVILQATLPRPAPQELRESTLKIIESFREKTEKPAPTPKTER